MDNKEISNLSVTALVLCQLNCSLSDYCLGCKKNSDIKTIMHITRLCGQFLLYPTLGSPVIKLETCVAM